MCSACAGDDPRPEMFARFDVSSPDLAEGFAEQSAEKRRNYGTDEIGVKTSKAALMLSVLPMGKNGWLRRLVYRTRRGETGGLKLAPWREVREVATRGERLIHAVAERSFSPARQHDGGRGGGSGAPTEVRVSGDSIIEVYGVDGSREEHFGREQHNRERARGVYDGADWVESREARDESQHALARYWRVRRAKSLAAYAVFGALAALIVWFAVR